MSAVRHRQAAPFRRRPGLAHGHRDPWLDSGARLRCGGGCIRRAEQDQAEVLGRGVGHKNSGNGCARHNHAHDSGRHLDSRRYPSSGNAHDGQSHPAEDPAANAYAQIDERRGHRSQQRAVPARNENHQNHRSTPTKTTSEPTKSTSENKETSSSETKTSTESEAPSPILLDTNAASVYNPYNYPASLFGDPGLAIDDEESTAWTAQVQAENAPKMAEGLLLDLKSPQKLGSTVVKTTTTGITVEVYGANGSTPPTSISDPAWARIVGLKVLKKKSTTLKLKTKGKGYRYIVLWLAKAPATSTAANPGSVSINEFELFPPKSRAP